MRVVLCRRGRVISSGSDAVRCDARCISTAFRPCPGTIAQRGRLPSAGRAHRAGPGPPPRTRGTSGRPRPACGRLRDRCAQRRGCLSLRERVCGSRGPPHVDRVLSVTRCAPQARMPTCGRRHGPDSGELPHQGRVTNPGLTPPPSSVWGSWLVGWRASGDRSGAEADRAPRAKRLSHWVFGDRKLSTCDTLTLVR